MRVSLDLRSGRFRMRGANISKKARSSQSVGDRVKITEVLEFAREGEQVLVAKIDGLARSTRDLMNISDTRAKKNVALKILNT